MKHLILTAFLLLAPPCYAQEAPKPPVTPTVRVAVPLTLGATAGQALTLDADKFLAFYLADYAGPVTWDITPADTRDKTVYTETLPKGTKIHGYLQGDAGPKLHTFPDTGSEILYVRGVGTGIVTVAAWGVKDAKAAKLAEQVVAVGGPQPKPPDPIPGPTPGPGPVPIPADGLRVLIVYETDATGLPKMAEAQRQVLFSGMVRSYLNAKCPTGADGKTHEWRMWDKDVDTTGESPLWQAAMKRDRKSVPSILISTGKDGFEGPLPATVDDAMKLLKKYGGE